MEQPHEQAKDVVDLCPVGLIFGVIDWYYLDLLAHFPWGEIGNNPVIVPIIIALNYGIWFVPVLPVTIYETRVSSSSSRSALAGAVCWSASILSYYSFYTLLLAFWGLPNMNHLLIMGDKPAGFWQEWTIAYQKIILSQVLEWLPIALIGGSLVGLVIWRITGHRKEVNLLGTGNS
jgi:hypothetical protein